jgi:hypothetical protein
MIRRLVKVRRFVYQHLLISMSFSNNPYWCLFILAMYLCQCPQSCQWLTDAGKRLAGVSVILKSLSHTYARGPATKRKLVREPLLVGLLLIWIRDNNSARCQSVCIRYIHLGATTYMVFWVHCDAPHSTFEAVVLPGAMIAPPYQFLHPRKIPTIQPQAANYISINGIIDPHV